MENECEGCPVCAGPGIELGALGATTHYRCRDCGFTFGVTEDWEALDGEEAE